MKWKGRRQKEEKGEGEGTRKEMEGSEVVEVGGVWQGLLSVRVHNFLRSVMSHVENML